MKIWMSDINTATYRLVKLNCEEHSDYRYIGEFNDEELKSFFLEIQDDMDIEKNKHYNPLRKGIPQLYLLKESERNQLIHKNPDYGEIVCRCEEISRGEILDALNSPIKVDTVDGIKRRTRAGMGRCQGGFCMPLVMEIICEHENLKMNQIGKKNHESVILIKETK